MLHICGTPCGGILWGHLAVKFNAGDWLSVSGFTNPVTYSTQINPPGTVYESGSSWWYTAPGTGAYTFSTTATDALGHQLSDSVSFAL
jgi:hypothetical protein